MLLVGLAKESLGVVLQLTERLDVVALRAEEASVLAEYLRSGHEGMQVLEALIDGVPILRDGHDLTAEDLAELPLRVEPRVQTFPVAELVDECKHRDARGSQAAPLRVRRTGRCR